MALIFTDPNSAGPFVTFGVKDPDVKVFKLTFSNFNTTPVNTLVGRLPADSSILRVDIWTKTKLSGGGVTAATISLGSSSGGTQYVNALDALTPNSGAFAAATPITGIMQPYQVPLGADLDIWVAGSATTGNPTAGEIYLVVTYVR